MRKQSLLSIVAAILRPTARGFSSISGWMCACVGVGLVLALGTSTQAAWGQSHLTLSASKLYSATASADLDGHSERFELIDIDTLFYIDNDGLDRILVCLNGHFFKLVTDPAEVHQSANAFLIPRFGEITIHIGAFIVEGGPNVIELGQRGLEGSANIIIGDLLLFGQRVAYAITELEDIPERFDLLQNYPNPFRTATTIAYKIPSDWMTGVDVRLAVYDARGRRVRTLVEDRRFPGRFEVHWDGRDGQGTAVPSGVYFCRLEVGRTRATEQLIVIR